MENYYHQSIYTDAPANLTRTGLNEDMHHSNDIQQAQAITARMRKMTMQEDTAHCQ
jgi:hypothetical protein